MALVSVYQMKLAQRPLHGTSEDDRPHDECTADGQDALQESLLAPIEFCGGQPEVREDMVGGAFPTRGFEDIDDLERDRVFARNAHAADAGHIGAGEGGLLRLLGYTK